MAYSSQKKGEIAVRRRRRSGGSGPARGRKEAFARKIRGGRLAVEERKDAEEAAAGATGKTGRKA